MAKLLMLALILLLAGCSARPSLPDVGASGHFSMLEAGVSNEDLGQQLARHKGIVAGLEAQLHSQREIHQENIQIQRETHLSAMAWIIAGCSILGAIGCIGLGLWLGRKMWFSFAVSLAGMAVVSLGFAALVPYLPIVGGVVVTGIIGVALWQVWKLKKSDEKSGSEVLNLQAITEESIRYGMEAAQATQETIESVKDGAALRQKSLGIHEKIHSMVTNLKPPKDTSVNSQ